jgi:hypothetical protein
MGVGNHLAIVLIRLRKGAHERHRGHSGEGVFDF